MPIPELDNFRKKYPQYNDIDDVTLATKLSSKYPQYSDLMNKVNTQSVGEVDKKVIPEISAAKDTGEIMALKTWKRKQPSKLSQVVRSFMRTSPIEEASTMQYNIDKMPEPLPGESLEAFSKRADEARGLAKREKEIVKQGTLSQLATPMQAALTVAGGVAPLATAKALGKFGVVELLSNITGANKLKENITSPTLRDITEIGEFGVKGALATVPWKSKGQTQQQVEKGIIKTFDKAIKPLVKGKQTLQQRQQYYKDAKTAVKDIVSDKVNIEKLPESVTELAQASKIRMDNLVSQWQNLEKVTQSKGIKPSLQPVISELYGKFVNNPAYKIRPEMQTYAKELATQLWQTPRDVVAISEQIKILNDTASKAFLDPSSIGKSQVDAVAVKVLRGILDKTIDAGQGKGWQELRNLYKAHKAIEKDINNAVIREAKKLNPGGLSDLLGTFGDADTVAGLITLNPGMITRGVVQRSALSFLKWFNDPNRLIKNMFQNVEKSGIPATAINKTQKQVVVIPTRLRKLTEKIIP